MNHIFIVLVTPQDTYSSFHRILECSVSHVFLETPRKIARSLIVCKAAENVRKRGVGGAVPTSWGRGVRGWRPVKGPQPASLRRRSRLRAVCVKQAVLVVPAGFS